MLQDPNGAGQLLSLPQRGRIAAACLLPLPFLSGGVKEKEGAPLLGAHLFFSPGTQLIGPPSSAILSAPISLALMDSQSAVVAPHSSFGLRCISGLVLPVLFLESLSFPPH